MICVRACASRGILLHVPFFVIMGHGVDPKALEKDKKEENFRFFGDTHRGAPPKIGNMNSSPLFSTVIIFVTKETVASNHVF